MKHIRYPVVLISLLVAACGAPGTLSPEDIPPEIEVSTTPQYKLGSGDVVSVSVWKNSDLNVRVPVRPDGYISVPLVGDVLAGGLTPEAVARATEKELLQYIRTPKVSIIVEQLNSAAFQNRVRVVGGVAEQMSISHRDGMTVLDLVLEAGGVNEFASPESAKLYRTVEGEPKVYPVYLQSILKAGILDTNYPLLPGDVISIPERRF